MGHTQPGAVVREDTDQEVVVGTGDCSSQLACPSITLI